MSDQKDLKPKEKIARTKVDLALNSWDVPEIVSDLESTSTKHIPVRGLINDFTLRLKPLADSLPTMPNEELVTGSLLRQSVEGNMLLTEELDKIIEENVKLDDEQTAQNQTN